MNNAVEVVMEKKITGDELSKLWDCHILFTWFNNQNHSCGKMVRDFLVKHRDTIVAEELYALNRVPSYHLTNASFWMWMNRTMFPIWDSLIGMKSTDVGGRIRMLKSLAQWTKCCKTYVRGGSMDNEMRRLKRQNRQNIATHMSGEDKRRKANESHSRSGQWNVCK